MILSVKQELLQYFYNNQYKYNYYPCYDKLTEYDIDGKSYDIYYHNIL